MSVPSSPRPVGTVRLVVYPSQSGKLGRLAVIQSHRGLGIGRQLMLALHEYVKTSSLRRVFMHAQVDKIDFYKKLGYSVYDANEFDECGIMHVKMDQSFPAVV
jgi:predicted GNAT family N-acyltransferase